ncbi:MAG: hypothetical protein KDM91_01470 [Verrucomicrobiae bacterium]|nr:hypothetical protein [Verrucomicrobiae bacterium]
MKLQPNLLTTLCLSLAAATATEVGGQEKPASEEAKSSTAAEADAKKTAAKSAAFYKQPVRLYSRDGRSIDARLMSASGDRIQIERVADGREFFLSMSDLDSRSADRVQLWMDRDPDAIEFAFDFQVEKRLVTSDTFEYAATGRTIKTAKWVYDVSMTNLTRSDLRNAELEYRIVYDDEVAITRGSAYPGEGRRQMEGGSLELPEVGYNGKAEFTTAPVTIETYEMKPLRGEKEYQRDTVVGLWIRVRKNGEIVHEFQNNAAFMGDLAWDNGEGSPIEVHDRFKDQFKSPR